MHDDDGVVVNIKLCFVVFCCYFIIIIIITL